MTRLAVMLPLLVGACDRDAATRPEASADPNQADADAGEGEKQPEAGPVVESPAVDRAADEAAIRAVEQAYVDGWLANDPDAVLALFTADAAIQPAGYKPIRGLEAIREYWWPAANPTGTRVTAFESSVEHLEVGAELAYLDGLGTITFEWTQDGELQQGQSQSAHVSVLRRTDGGWKLVRRVWAQLAKP